MGGKVNEEQPLQLLGCNFAAARKLLYGNASCKFASIHTCCTLHFKFGAVREVPKTYVLSPDACRDEKAKLSQPCADEIFKTQVEGAQDYRTDADLHVACEPDAKQICPNVKPGEGRIQDCLVSFYTVDRRWNLLAAGMKGCTVDSNQQQATHPCFLPIW